MGSEPLDFDDVVARAAIGDHDAIGHLWRTHHPYLVRWLRSTASEAAEDLASDTWFDVVRCLGQFEGTEASFRSWLFTIARRRLIDHQRRAIRRPDRTLALVPEATSSSDPAEDVAVDDASQRAVAVVLEHLAPDQAQVVLLCVLGGLDAGQVADVLGKTRGAVRVLQHRGLRRLAEVLTESAPEENSELGVTR